MPSQDLAKMRKDAQDIFLAGVKAVEAEAAVRRHCRMDGDHFVVDEKVYDLSKYEKVFVLGAGKASASMAKALEEMLGQKIAEGLVCVKYDHLAPVNTVRLVEAAHPVPDKPGQDGAQAIMTLASKAQKGDLVISAFSGGGSALLPLPVEGVRLEDKQEATKLLLACGATIHEINAVRKHISQVKGGGLARAVSPATHVALILSDVVGDDLDVIASGPTVPDSSTFADCLKIFTKYGITEKVPEAVLDHIRQGVEGNMAENPKPGDPLFQTVQNAIVGSNMECVLTAEKKARALGYHTLILSSMIEGETIDVAHVHGGIAKEIVKTGHPLSAPACVLSGGETTVTIKGDGLGGRNQEFALAAACIISGWDNVVMLSGGTDGTDGPTDAAGAVVDGFTVTRGQELGLDAATYLSNNDAYHFFEGTGDLIKTGPTNTNVMDLRIVLVV